MAKADSDNLRKSFFMNDTYCEYIIVVLGIFLWKFY